MIEAVKRKTAKEWRARCAAIALGEAANGREKLAQHLALETEMSVEQALAILEASARETKPAKPTSRLDLVPRLSVTGDDWAAVRGSEQHRRGHGPEPRTDDPQMGLK